MIERIAIGIVTFLVVLYGGIALSKRLRIDSDYWR